MHIKNNIALIKEIKNFAVSFPSVLWMTWAGLCWSDWAFKD